MPTGFRVRMTAATTVLVCAVGLTPAPDAQSTTTRTRPFARPPYYQGRPPAAGAQVVHLAPVVRGSPDTPDAWLPQEALRRLADEIDQFVQTESLSRVSSDPVSTDGKVRAPTVYFGCELDGIGECDGNARANVIVTTGGTPAWRTRIAEISRVSGADHVLVLELRLAPQWIQQKNLSGRKEVRLGTDHVQRLAWLTSLDSPVWVLQLTGALVDAEGKVVRSGAEGLWAVRTPFRSSVVRAERLMNDDEVEFVRTELVRDDLPGRPLAWQTAVRQLVHGLVTPSPS